MRRRQRQTFTRWLEKARQTFCGTVSRRTVVEQRLADLRPSGYPGTIKDAASSHAGQADYIADYLVWLLPGYPGQVAIKHCHRTAVFNMLCACNACAYPAVPCHRPLTASHVEAA